MARIIDTLVARFKWDTDTSGADEALSSVQRVQKGVSGAGRAFAAAGAAFGAAGFFIGEGLYTFSGAINTLRSVLADTVSEDQIQTLREQAISLGETTVRTAEDAAGAQVALARAGFSFNEIMAATPAVLNLAIAGELEMGEAALVVAKQIRAFNLPANEAVRVVDSLAHASRLGLTNVRELGPAFRQVAPLASQMGMSIENVAAMIVSLRDIGLIPQQAGTALRNIMSILTETPTRKRLGAFEKLGLDWMVIRDLVVDGKVQDAFKQIQRGLQTLTKGEQASVMGEIFDREARIAAVHLVENTKHTDGLIASMQDATGAGAQMGRDMTRDLYGAVKLMTAALDTLMKRLGDAGFTWVLENLAKAIRAVANALSDAHPVVQVFLVVVLALGIALGGVGAALIAAGVAIAAWTQVVTFATVQGGRWLVVLKLQAAALRLLNPLTYAHAAALVVRTAATWAATAAQWALNVAMRANPILAVIGLIVAIIAVIWQFRDAIWNGLKAAWDWVKKNWPLLAAILLGPIGLLIYAVKNWGAEIKAVFKAIWDAIVGAVVGAVNWVKNAVVDMVNFLASMPDRIYRAFAAVFRKLGQLWEQHAPWWLKKIVGGVGGILGKIAGFLGFGGGGGDARVSPPPAVGRTSVIQTTNVNVDRLDVNTQATDASGVAGGIREALEAEYQNTRHAFDNGVAV